MKITKYITILGIIVSITSTVYASRGNTDSNLLINALFVLWAASPFILLFTLNHYVKDIKIVRTVLMTSVVCLLLNYDYINSLFINPDAQSGLTFLFVPLYQFAIILVGVIIGYIWSRFTKD